MKRFFLIAAVLVTTTTLYGQDKYIYLNIDASKPLSNTSWISDMTLSAGKLGFRGFILPNFSAGLDLGWANFNQYVPTETRQTGSGAITTDYFNYIYTYSAAVSGQYYLKDEDEDRLMPYVGLGLGASTNEYVLYYNVYQDSERSWGFLARPEAGVLFRFTERSSLGLMAAVHFDYTTNKSRNFDYNHFSALGFQLGLISMSF